MGIVIGDVAALNAPKPSRLRMTNRYSWNLHGTFTTSVVASSGTWGTAVYCIPCPADFVAVRVAFANINSATYPISLIKVCPSSSFNDYVNPTGGASWVTLTSANAGADVDQIVTVGGAGTSHTITANGTDASSGSTIIPAWYWTDWVNVNSATPDPTTGMRVLMIRHLGTKGNTYTFLNGAFDGYTGVSSVNHGYDYAIGGYNNGSDHVTTPDVMDWPTAKANRLVNGSIIACVQFMTTRLGVVGMTTGDSVQAGTTSSFQFNNYLLQSTAQVGSQNIASVPYGMASSAAGGAVSETIFPSFLVQFPFIQPSYVVLPSWSFNELNSATHADTVACNRFLARMLMAARYAEAQGAIPIITTPFPRDSANMGATQVSAWLAVYNAVMAMKSAIVVDVSTQFSGRSNGIMTAVYPSGSEYTTDGVHPNDRGHAFVASLINPIIQNLISQH